MQNVPLFVSIAVVVLFGISVLGIHRVRAREAHSMSADGSTDNALLWLLMMAAFVGGAFFSYVLLRP